MSFARGSGLAGTSTPQQPPNPHRPSLYPSLVQQTPATPTPASQQQPSFLQQPPQRPASVPLSFGSLSHSASTPSFSVYGNDPATSGTGAFGGSFATQPGQQQQNSGFGSPAPQPPLTTFDLSGNSPFQKPAPGMGWGGGLGGHSLTRSHSQQFMPQQMTQNPLAERRYLPSHLRVSTPPSFLL
jgi:hypothetical protein